LSAIKLVDVWKSYQPDTPILRGVDLEVDMGSFISIRGKSGAGKSTLLRIMGLLDAPERGRVYLLGQDSMDMSDDEASEIRLRHIGFVFQFFNLIPTLTVLENIELPMALAGVRRDVRRGRAMELLDRFGMRGLADRFPSQLSGGEQQRVAVLRALANNPAIILADEPTASLDEENSEVLLELFREINEEDLVTIVMTTVSHEEKLPTQHDYLLKNGRIYPLR